MQTEKPINKDSHKVRTIVSNLNFISKALVKYLGKEKAEKVTLMVNAKKEYMLQYLYFDEFNNITVLYNSDKLKTFSQFQKELEKANTLLTKVG